MSLVYLCNCFPLVTMILKDSIINSWTQRQPYATFPLLTDYCSVLCRKPPQRFTHSLTTIHRRCASVNSSVTLATISGTHGKKHPRECSTHEIWRPRCSQYLIHERSKRTLCFLRDVKLIGSATYFTFIISEWATQHSTQRFLLLIVSFLFRFVEFPWFYYYWGRASCPLCEYLCFVTMSLTILLIVPPVKCDR